MDDGSRDTDGPRDEKGRTPLVRVVDEIIMGLFNVILETGDSRGVSYLTAGRSLKLLKGP